MLENSRDRGVIRPGAHRLQRLLWGMGFCSLAPAPVILVTGTNGKGTVCAFLESALRACDLKTGLYTSPHLVSVEERVRVDGIPVSSQDFQRALNFVKLKKEEFLPDASDFELYTATAAVLFHEAQVQIGVIEIGLGGLLDSTNAVPPVVSVLTGVGIDHVEFLGNSLSSIAADKAFISRRNMPFVIGSLDGESLEAVRKTVGVTGAILVNSQMLSQEWEHTFRRVTENSSHWVKENSGNLRVAIAAIASLEKYFYGVVNSRNVIKGLREAQWPGRFDVRKIRGRTVIFDGAHNVSGFEFFACQYENSVFASQKSICLYASLSDKDWRKILPRLTAMCSRMILTQVNSVRAVPCTDLFNYFVHSGGDGSFAQRASSVSEAVDCAFCNSNENCETPILVVGSLALVGEVMENLKLDPFEMFRDGRRVEA